MINKIPVIPKSQMTIKTESSFQDKFPRLPKPQNINC